MSQFCCKIAFFEKEQTSTFRQKNLDQFCLKFRAELNEFIRIVQKKIGSASTPEYLSAKI